MTAQAAEDVTQNGSANVPSSPAPPAPPAPPEVLELLLQTVRTKAREAVAASFGDSPELDVSVLAGFDFGGKPLWSILAKHPEWPQMMKVTESSATAVLKRFHEYMWETAPVCPVLDLERH